MKKHGLAALIAITLFAGCATKQQSPWKVERVTLPDNEVRSRITFMEGNRPLLVREEAPYLHYRAVPRGQFARYHIPEKAASALVATKDLNNDVLFAMDAPKAWEIYAFSFGKFDIDWPPKKVGEVRR